ncbi:MAG TPA: nucleotidyltransferase domain-containing protein [Thermoanaerobaculia bacterium]|nr:nucleotidyltransferase domain-containing protein [Thermoanaerobaculia bacterium]
MSDNRTKSPASAERFPLGEAEVASFCRKHRIRKLSLFGLVLREDFGPTSDVDVLVEFADGDVPGFGFIRIQEELSTLLGGRRVELLTPRALSPFLREKILRSAETRYGA